MYNLLLNTLVIKIHKSHLHNEIYHKNPNKKGLVFESFLCLLLINF